MTKRFAILGFVIDLLSLIASNTYAQQKRLLSFDKLKSYVGYFNAIDTETVKNYVTNDHAYEWLAKMSRCLNA
ncbi:MAG: glycoside hydrolase [Mucilaginibacter sp.]|nr:glycoside hydrolase [Mucilaginibacter sp.]